MVKQIKNLPHVRSENLAIKLSSNIPIKLLTTDLDVYFSIFKQYIKQLSLTSLALMYNHFIKQKIPSINFKLL